MFEELGGELALLHRVEVRGAGPVIAVDEVPSGASATWRGHCEAFADRFLEAHPGDERVATLRSMGDLDTGHWLALRDMVSEHGNGTPVLCHYDNRLPNLLLDRGGVSLLDWDLARIAPLSHELIKLYERPPADARRDAEALLRGYGVPSERHGDIVRHAQGRARHGWHRDES